jgi:hypothetical protein
LSYLRQRASVTRRIAQPFLRFGPVVGRFPLVPFRDPGFQISRSNGPVKNYE